MNPDELLPVEIWLKILNYPIISCVDLCKVMCTSRYLSTVAASPQLWTRCLLNKEKVKEEGLEMLLSIPRFSLLQTLDMSSSRLSIQQIVQTLTAIKASDTIEEVNFKSVDLSGAPVDLLGEMVIGLKIANLSASNLTEEHCTAVLTNIEASNLDDLDLKAVHNLNKVDPELFKNLTKSKKVNLAQTNLSPFQSTVLFANIPFSKLTDLNLFCVSLRFVDPATVAEGFSHLEKVNLSQTWLTNDQSSAMFSKSFGPNFPKEANFNNVSLSSVPPQLISTGTARLTKASLVSSDLTTEQVTAICSQILQGTSLQEIKLQNNKLVDVSPELLPDALSRVETVNISCTEITPENVSLLLTRNNSCIKDINLHGIKLSKVSNYEVFKSMSRFRRLRLSNTSMSTEQSTVLLTSILDSHLLQELDLSGVNLSGVDADLLAEVVRWMKQVNLNLTRMTEEQMEKVLEQVCRSARLTHITLEMDKIVKASPSLLTRVNWARPVVDSL